MSRKRRFLPVIFLIYSWLIQSTDIMCYHLSSKMQTYHQPSPTIFPINTYPPFPPRHKYYPAFVILSPLWQISRLTPKKWNMPLPIMESASDTRKNPDTIASKEINDANNAIEPNSATLSVVSSRPIILKDKQDVREQINDVGQWNGISANNSTTRPDVKNATTDDNFSLQDFIIQDRACSRSDCHNYSQFCLIYAIQSLISLATTPLISSCQLMSEHAYYRIGSG